jgi:hypothetical protein
MITGASPSGMRADVESGERACSTTPHPSRVGHAPATRGAASQTMRSKVATQIWLERSIA